MKVKRAMVRWLGLALVPALPMLWGCDTRTEDTEPVAPDGWSAPATAVVGELGGVPVSIPRDYARLVEYEGDPMSERAGFPSEHNYQSKLKSFNVIAHFPDMTPVTRENYNSYRKRDIYDSGWMEFTVAAGPALNFTEDKFEHPYEYRVPGNEWHRFYAYEQLPMIHGLTPYRATRDLGLDLTLDDNNRSHGAYNHTLYFARDENNKIMAVIRCGSGLTPEPGGRHICQHDFVLWPEMKAELRLRYDPSMLSRWRAYQNRYRELVLGFRVKTEGVRRLASVSAATP